MSSKDSTMKFSSTDHAHKILSNLNFLRKNGLFCDIEITVGNSTFWAHKALLSASSSYFQAMFTSGLSETEKRQIELHGIDERIFVLLIDFIYTGQLEITNNNVQDVIVASDMLQLTELIETCSNFLKKQLHLTNCIGIHLLAENHTIASLRTSSENFVNRNFVKVTKEDEFLALNLNDAQKILKSDKLEIDDEMQALQSALDWLTHDLQSRRKHFCAIMAQIRFGLIAKTKLDEFISKCDDSALKSAFKSLKLQNPTNHKPRAFNRRRIYVIGGYNREIGQRWSESCTLGTAQVYHVPKKEWQTLPDMHIARSGHGAAAVDGKLYVIGGESDDSMIFSHGEVYDPSAELWEMLPNMVRPRTLHAVCAFEGLLYALGGWIGSSLGDSIEFYDPATNRWTENGVLDTPRCAAGVAAHDGSIYVVGGLSETLTELDDVDRYDPANLTWKKAGKMRAHRAYAGAVVLGEFLYAIGGSGGAEKGLSTVERLNLLDGNSKWENVQPMGVARVSPCVAAVDGRVYVMGGRTSSDEFSPATTLAQIECYDPGVDKWSLVGEMRTSCCDSAVIVM